MLETARRKSLAWLNSQYIYGRVPLLHAFILFIELAMAARLVAKFNSYYAQKPVLTTMITNAVLGGVADTVAQTITAFRARQAMLPADAESNNSLISSGVELEDLNEKPARLSPALSPRHRGPQPFDFERLTRFMAYGFLMAPVQFLWFGRLNKWFPITPKSGTIPALKRVAFDQICFAPFGLSAFFTFMTVAEGGGKEEIVRKFQDVYLPTLKANYILWPAVQIINFRLMPLQFQIPFVSTVGIAWTAYLSLTNSSEDEVLQQS
ncbi:hypothetical protein HRR83_008737 [Exophiala dermatitidis]|uniref:Protein Mpv17 n=3 Tax=Exophiala dermatitidis TaxID=5970 RepID=H6BXC2_EXODN|nr:uncharacterized protein HMPREF1120_04314 [Exophiala dermatitidis NIH/UT8656]KAJ4503924.1 hypothetical protein HRR75_007947 [Exophiala dermatitidis]EHY56224.1 hypothetical protein HMPREF1120_04314 [Exophiala dermatitidis NIH/UT8656]KAJ4505279.1 hypothetical protein HRR73_008552 [Exophiala dermatitidis]KAJ4505738.1 hypothetical protein HRR74_008649 [Exophiala dermatitidis]KAJ4536330.1 hypothetical protein HRR77_007256 [Exophiala dermatitidis]